MVSRKLENALRRLVECLHPNPSSFSHGLSSVHQAIKELNVKPKNWRELLTEEPFTRADIITLQVRDGGEASKWRAAVKSQGSVRAVKA